MTVSGIAGDDPPSFTGSSSVVRLRLCAAVENSGVISDFVANPA